MLCRQKKQSWEAIARYGYGLNLTREERGLRMAFSPNGEETGITGITGITGKAACTCLLHLLPSPLPACIVFLYLFRRNLAEAVLITCSQFQPNEGRRIPPN